jgi:hypothetical protein
MVSPEEEGGSDAAAMCVILEIMRDEKLIAAKKLMI